MIVLFCGLVQLASAENETLVAKPCPSGMTGITVNPQDLVPLGTCADLSIVEGWYGKLVYYNTGTPIIDISSFTRRIWIEPSTWKVGRYDEWVKYEAPNANLFAFVVVAENVTKEEKVNITANISAPLAPVYEMIKYNLPEKRISDVLIARGDELSFNNTEITNKSIAWLFGIENGVYAYPCNDTQLLIPASALSEMKAGEYKLVIESPGNNTVLEAEYVSEKKDPADRNKIVSPFRKTPPLDIEGQSPRNIYDKFLPWLKEYSDDPIIEFKLTIQDPAVEIAGIGTAYSGDTDIWQVDGYTNLKIGSDVFAVIDENNKMYEIVNPPRTYAKVKGSIEKPGVMREFRIMVPLDWQNKTSGMHTVTVHGDYGARTGVERWLYDIPEEQERPVVYNRYADGNLFVPTPPPEIVTVEVTKNVIKEVTVVQIQTVDYNKLANEQVYQSVPLIASYIGWGLILGLPLLYLVWVALRAVYRLMTKKEKDGGN